MMRQLGLIVVACAMLGACGSETASQNTTADQLANAADQSDPAAAQVLDNASAQAANQADAGGNASGEMAQDALQNAGAAQVGNTQ